MGTLNVASNIGLMFFVSLNGICSGDQCGCICDSNDTSRCCSASLVTFIASRCS
jgi:hypothetical protein